MRSLRSRMSICTSRWLFCVTTSPVCGATLRRNTRGPASVAVNRTRTDTGIAVGRQPHRLRADDAPLVLDVERDGLPGVAGLRQHGVHQQRRSLERGARHRDAPDLDVVRQRFLPDADGEDRQRFGLRGEQRVGDGRVGRVGAVADQHEARHRKSRQFLARALDRVGDPGLRAARTSGPRPRRRARSTTRSETCG